MDGRYNSGMRTRILGLVSVLVAWAASPPAQEQSAGPPNLVFIYTDDQGAWTVGAAGNADAHTPNIDRIYREGCQLPNAFVTTPVCSPARGSLMTSRYASEIGIPDWIIPDKEDWLGLDPKLPTWPRMLQGAGYHTALIGKWHLGRTQEQHHPTNYGYEYFMGHRAGGWAAKDPTLEKDGKPQKFEGLTEDILTTETLAFIDKYKAEPFAVSLHFRAPHTAWLPVGPEDDDKHHETFPKFKLPHEGVPELNESKVQANLRDYYSSVTCVDRNVGRVLDQLDKLGLAENTIVVFTSDHGYNVGQYGLWSKGNAQKRYVPSGERVYPNIPPNQRPNLYDTSLRVPCAVRWPAGIEEGSEVCETVDNLDWFPTLCELTGAKLPEKAVLHGSSFATLLRGGDMEDWDNSLYCEWDMRQGAYTHMRALRTTDWKYVIDFLNEDAEGRQRGELYDLQADPEERVNLFGAEEHRELQAQLHDRLCKRIAKLGDHLRTTTRVIMVNFMSVTRYDLIGPSTATFGFPTGLGFWNNIGEPLGKGDLTTWRDLFDSSGHETTVDIEVTGGNWRSRNPDAETRGGGAPHHWGSWLELEEEVVVRVSGLTPAFTDGGYHLAALVPPKDGNESLVRWGKIEVRADGELVEGGPPIGYEMSAPEFTITGSAIELSGLQIIAK